MSKPLSIVLAWMALTTSPAQGSSFDCGKAGTKIEKMICADVSATDQVRIHELTSAGAIPLDSKKQNKDGDIFSQRKEISFPANERVRHSSL